MLKDQNRFAAILKGEVASMVKCIEAITNPEFKHETDPKAKTAMQYASMLAGSAVAMQDVLRIGELGTENSTPVPPVTTIAEAAKVISDGYNAVLGMLENISDEDWEKPSIMWWNGKKMWEDTRGGMVWGLMTDMIHHRGQLSTMLRPMGSKVPSIYGPSGDDMGGFVM